MNQPPLDGWEARVEALAATLPYPPTPHLAPRVRRHLEAQRAGRAPLRRLAWAALVVLLVLAGLLAVPGVRAAVQEWLQIGAIHIRVEPTLEAGVVPAQVPATMAVEPTPTPFFHDLIGATTLEEAEAQTRMHVRLPTYPADLGLPDRVFLQTLEGEAVILLWLDPDDPNTVRLSLHQLSETFWAEKSIRSADTVLAETEVNEEHAVWISGPHWLEVQDAQGNLDWREARLIDGNVLIWVEFNNTYRLETTLPLEEAVHMAESLR